MKRFIHWFKVFIPLHILCLLALAIIYIGHLNGLAVDYGLVFFLSSVTTVGSILFTIIESRLKSRKQW